MVCPHRNCCFGPIPPLVLEDAKAYFKQLNVPFVYKQGKIHGWRIRSKLAIRGSSSNPQIGLFKEGSHEIIDIPNCSMHHPKINEASQVLREWIKENDIRPYNESKGTGDLRYAQFVVERATSKVQLTLVFNFLDIRPALLKKLEQLWKKRPDLWHSLWFNGNERKVNTIFGMVWIHLYGSEWLWEDVLGRKVCFKPSSFGQSNLDAFEDLLDSMRGHISHGKKITEFYAGIGVIAMCLLDISRDIVCSEINQFSKECFDNAVKGFSEEERLRIHYEVGPAATQVELLNQSEIVIVDPPRKGLDKNLLSGLLESTQVKELVYISCGWDSFKRDCSQLIEKKWKLHVVEGYLFFPGSDHIETLAIFKRA